MEEYKINPLGLPVYLKRTGQLNDLTIVDESKAPKLFQKITIKQLELKNRLVVSPCCTYSATSGHVNDFHLSHYGALIKGGAGLVMVEATAVVPEGRITYQDLGIWSDSHIKGFKRITNFAKQFGANVSIQLAHGGRKSSCHPLFLDGSKNAIPEDDKLGRGWKVKGPSNIPWSDKLAVPIEMTLDDIKQVIESFKQGARRALEAGFDLVEIHGAHGYLISSFLSSTSNKRTDEYGGSFEGRIKLLLDIIQAVRSVWPSEKPLAVRISCEEYVEGGWNMDDTVRLAKILDKLDVDILDCSSGGNSSTQTFGKIGPLYQVPFAHQAKQSVSKLLVGAVGIITNGVEAESVLQEEKADLIFVGRGFLKNPHLTYQFADQLNVTISYAPQYELSNRKHRVDM